MNLQLSGHHLDLTPAIRSYVNDKLNRTWSVFTPTGMLARPPESPVWFAPAPASPGVNPPNG